MTYTYSLGFSLLSVCLDVNNVCHTAVAMQNCAEPFGTAMLRSYWCGS